MTKKYAVIDLGTNSARLMLAHVHDREITTISKQLNTIRIGEDMSTTGKICSEAFDRCALAINEFIKIIHQNQIDDFFVFATSAVREALNSKEFTEYVSKNCNVYIDVVSGKDEAKYAYLGAVRNKTNCAVIDIGGGSTEIISDDKTYYSFKLGAVRSLNLYMKKNNAYELLENSVNEIINAHDLTGFADKKFYAVGGTATTLGAIHLGLDKYLPEKINGCIMSASDINKLTETLVSMSAEDKLKIKGLEPKRADVIAYGALILNTFVQKLNIKSITLSDSDNTEGYLLAKLFNL